MAAARQNDVEFKNFNQPGGSWIRKPGYAKFISRVR
jgi:hypothetical protein